jgi:predicted ArsR family transcriptional regulator
MPSIESIASSRVRLSIASLITIRPRTLTELAELTGVSVQAVLKHLARLDREGLVGRSSLGQGEHLRQRKLYSLKTAGVEGYAHKDIIVAALTSPRPAAGTAPGRYSELEGLAEEVIFRRARMRDVLKRLERAIGEVAEEEARLRGAIEGVGLSPEDKQIAAVIFTEDDAQSAKTVLRKHFGCPDPEAAVAEVVGKLGGK